MNVEVKVVKATDEAKPYTAGMEEGWNQTLDKLVTLIGARASRPQ